MAKVQVRVVGGGVRELDARTVGEAKGLLGLQTYGAVINGNPVRDEHALQGGESIVLATNSKGGAR